MADKSIPQLPVATVPLTGDELTIVVQNGVTKQTTVADFGGGGGGGGVTAVSVVSANGFAGASSGGLTPALTLSTTVNGLMYGDATAIQSVTIGSGLTFAAGTLSATTGGAATWATLGDKTGASGPITIALGKNSAQTVQGTASIAIGEEAAGNLQGSQAIAIGKSSALISQGNNAIAIGAYAGANNQAANSIVINATGSALENTTASSLKIAPIRSAAASAYSLYYDTSTSEITYGPSGGGGGGGGIVNSVAVSSLNGFAGTSTGGANPVLTLSTSVSGILYGNGTSLSPVTIGSGLSFAGGTLSNTGSATTGSSILYGDGSGGFSNVTIGSGLTFAGGTLSASGGGGTTWATLGDKTNAAGPDTIALGKNAGATLKAVSFGENAFSTDGGVAIGLNAGASNTGTNAISIGENAGLTNTTAATIAIGYNAQTNGAFDQSIAIGYFAGNIGQQGESIAIGPNAGKTSQGNYNVAFGSAAGQTNQAGESVAVGWNAGKDNQGVGAIAIGSASGSYQGNYAIALGWSAGGKINPGDPNQAANTIVINASGNVLPNLGAGTLVVDPIRSATATSNSLYYNTTTKEVTYGPAGGGGGSGTVTSVSVVSANGFAGTVATATTTPAITLSTSINGIVAGNGTSLSAVTIGSGLTFAGGTLTATAASPTWATLGDKTGASGPTVIGLGYLVGDGGAQGAGAVAIGNRAGRVSQGAYSVALGWFAGDNTQGSNSVAIGIQAGQTSQGADAVAVGKFAGQTNQGAQSVAIGVNAQSTGAHSISIGDQAAYQGSSDSSVIIGNGAASVGATIEQIAIGKNAGNTNNNGAYSVSIGSSAGNGNYSVSIGYQANGYFASAGVDNAITINATGALLQNLVAGSFKVAPIRSLTSTPNALYYDTTTKEISYVPSSYTVATLPSAATAGQGARAFVTDADSSVFYSIVATGGGPIHTVPVFSDGTNWRVG